MGMECRVQYEKKYQNWNVGQSYLPHLIQRGTDFDLKDQIVKEVVKHRDRNDCIRIWFYEIFVLQSTIYASYNQQVL